MIAELIHNDICIIGSGTEGLSVAAEAVQVRNENLLIEQGQMVGDWMNRG